MIENSICGALYNCKTHSPDTSVQGHVHNGDLPVSLMAAPLGVLWAQGAVSQSHIFAPLVPSGKMPSGRASLSSQEDDRARWGAGRGEGQWEQVQAAWSLGRKGWAGLGWEPQQDWWDRPQSA